MTDLIKKTLAAEIAALDKRIEAKDAEIDKLDTERERYQEALDALDPKPDPTIIVNADTHFGGFKPGSVYKAECGPWYMPFASSPTGRSPWYGVREAPRASQYDVYKNLSEQIIAGHFHSNPVMAGVSGYSGYAKLPKYSFKKGDRVEYNDVIYGQSASNGSVGVVETDVYSDTRETYISVRWESNPNVGGRVYGGGPRVSSCHIGNITKIARYNFKAGDRVKYAPVMGDNWHIGEGTVTRDYSGDENQRLVDVKFDKASWTQAYAENLKKITGANGSTYSFKVGDRVVQNGYPCQSKPNRHATVTKDAWATDEYVYVKWEDDNFSGSSYQQHLTKVTERKFQTNDRVRLKDASCNCTATITSVSGDGMRADLRWSVSGYYHASDRTVDTSRLKLV